jgi:hypothetical protein
MSSKFTTKYLRQAFSRHQKKDFEDFPADNLVTDSPRKILPSERHPGRTPGFNSLAIDYGAYKISNTTALHALSNPPFSSSEIPLEQDENLEVSDNRNSISRVHLCQLTDADDGTKSRTNFERTSNHTSRMNRQVLSLREENDVCKTFANLATRYFGLGPMYLEAQAEKVAEYGPFEPIEARISKFFDSVCITDHKAGNPIRLRSKNFALGSAGLAVGACKFLNLPNGYLAGCTIWTEEDAAGMSRFVLLLWDPLLSVESGATKAIVASQLDITEVIRELALQEHLQNSVTDSQHISKRWSGGDWLDFAGAEDPTDALSNCSSEQLPPPGPSLRRFLAFIHRLVTLHTSKIVFIPVKSKSNTQVEQAMEHWTPRLVSPNLFGMTSVQLHTLEATRLNISQSMDNHVSFQSELYLEDQIKRPIYGVPVSEGLETNKGQLEWCVCFVTDPLCDTLWDNDGDTSLMRFPYLS